MSEAQSLLFPKLTEENLRLLESQISNLELLGKLRSRCGKLPADVKAVITSALEDLTSAKASNPAPSLALSDDQLRQLRLEVTENILTSAKVWFKAIYQPHMTVEEIFADIQGRMYCDAKDQQTFLDIVHTFCEKVERSPESPQ